MTPRHSLATVCTVTAVFAVAAAFGARGANANDGMIGLAYAAWLVVIATLSVLRPSVPLCIAAMVTGGISIVFGAFAGCVASINFESHYSTDGEKLAILAFVVLHVALVITAARLIADLRQSRATNGPPGMKDIPGN